MPLSNNLSLGQRLRRERERLKWSQERLAEAVGTTARSINRWEQDKVMPHPHYRELLCNVFNVPADTLFGSAGEVLTQAVIWNVPARRNPLFTGREDVLEALAKALHTTEYENAVGLTQIQAISGLGGIGKTQIAIEYAYRYRNDYRAVLWVRAETREIFLADLVALAEPLNMPEKSEHEQQRVLEAVKRWLCSYDRWLLILDNVEDATLITDILPSECKGHVLLTTRSQATGPVVQRIDVVPMEIEEGALLLLRRAKLIAPETTLADVSEQLCCEAGLLSQELGGLPLALDQAGAYIEETACAVSTYLSYYRTQQALLLHRRGEAIVDHLQSVTTTFSQAIERVEQVHPAAADLLRLCAFLHPDAIPEEIITVGASECVPLLQPMATDALALDTAIKDLRKFSLLQRNAQSKTLTIHRLVQAVIKGEMDEKTQHQWAERAVKAVNSAFPNADQWETWPRCQSCLPHAYACVLLVDKWDVALPQASRLIYQAALYLFLKCALYPQAETLYRQALTIREHLHGHFHPDVAECLNDLALLSYRQGKYDQAESLYRQALVIREQTQEPTHPELAHTQCNLAQCYFVQGNYALAQPLVQRALATREQVLGLEHPQVAESLTLLATILSVQGNYTQAEQFFQKSSEMYKRMLGPENPQVASNLNSWAQHYSAQGNYTQAETLLQRALAIRERILGPEHPQVAQCLNNLAELAYQQDRYVQAEMFYQRALAIWENALEINDPHAVRCSERYADLLRKLKQQD